MSQLIPLRVRCCPADGGIFPEAPLPPLQAHNREAGASSLAGAEMVCHVHRNAAGCARGQHADVCGPPEGCTSHQDLTLLESGQHAVVCDPQPSP